MSDDIPEVKAKVAITYKITSIKTKNTEDLIKAIKKISVKQALSNKEIKALFEVGRAEFITGQLS
jgi:hypothetical protein